jgi:DNA transformation protein and related proteins
MSVSDEFLSYIMDQLRPMPGITARKMFGGAGIMHNGKMFGLVSDDVLFLKTDDSNRKDYETQDMEQFKPWPEKPMTMPYHQVPVDVFEDRDLLKEWARKSIAVAAKTPQKKKRK